MDIDALRQKIDAVDSQLLELLNRRAAIARQVGQWKIKNGHEFYKPHREKAIIAALTKKNAGPLPAISIESIYREILSACRSLEARLKISYLGPEATFSHLAAMKNFGPVAEYIPAKTISDVFPEVEKGRADYGVVPIENSTDGIVNHTLDMFIDSDLVICSEISMPIELYLLSRTGNKKDIKRVYSHPQPLGQSRKWLATNLPGIPIIEKSSTTEAARCVQREKDAAAVASKAAAVLYGLETVARGIEDSRENITRFFIIGRQRSQVSGYDKTSLLFSIKDKVGALHDILMVFKKYRINLTKIESRPTKKKAWEYIFFVDFLGHISDKKVQEAVKQLSRHCVFIKVLGSYPRAE
jgi:chorismate mutase/prephenate dehydratase